MKLFRKWSVSTVCKQLCSIISASFVLRHPPSKKGVSTKSLLKAFRDMKGVVLVPVRVRYGVYYISWLFVYGEHIVFWWHCCFPFIQLQNIIYYHKDINSSTEPCLWKTTLFIITLYRAYIDGQVLRALNTLAEDLGLVPGTYMVSQNHLQLQF